MPKRFDTKHYLDAGDDGSERARRVAKKPKHRKPRARRSVEKAKDRYRNRSREYK